MASLALVQKSSPEVLPPQNPEVMSLLREVRLAAKDYRNSMARIAYYGWRLRYSVGGKAGDPIGDWAALGVQIETEEGTRLARTEDEFREALGIPRSTYYKYLQIGQALHQLKLEDLHKITVSNAENLIKVDPAIIADFPWVSEAKTIPSQQFAKLVAQRNKQSGSMAEPTTYFRCKVPITAKKFLEDTVEKFRVENDLASSGEALELLIADVHDRPNTMTAIKRALDKISWARGRFFKRLRNKETQEVSWLFEVEKSLRTVYNAERMGRDSDAEDAETVYPAQASADGKSHNERFGIVSKQSIRTLREETPGDEALAEAGGPLCSLQFDDEADGDDDGVKGGQG